MNKHPLKASGGKWANGAFPTEASLKYDEVDVGVVLSRVAEAEKALAGEEWEVVDGFNYPYAKSA